MYTQFNDLFTETLKNIGSNMLLVDNSLKLTIKSEPKVTIKNYVNTRVISIDSNGDGINNDVVCDATFDFSNIPPTLHESVLKTILYYQPTKYITYQSVATKTITNKLQGTKGFSQQESLFKIFLRKLFN